MSTMPAAAGDQPFCGTAVLGPASAVLGAAWATFVCTRPRGHNGDHAAHGVDDIEPIYVWPRS